MFDNGIQIFPCDETDVGWAGSGEVSFGFKFFSMLVDVDFLRTKT